MKKFFRWVAKIEHKKIWRLSIISQNSVDIFTLIIIVSAILMGFEVIKPSPFLRNIQRVILYVFLLEIFLRAIIAHVKKNFKRHICDPWSIFDIIVVGAGFVPSSLQNFSNILRIFRVFRILRVIKAFPDIKLIVSIILKCIPRMGAIGVLLLIMMYVYAIIGIQLFTSSDNVRQPGFETFQESFFTLFVELTADNWKDVRDNGVARFGYLGPTIYHVTWILLSAFLVFNLFIGVILDSFSSLRASELKRKKYLKLNRGKPYTLVLGWNPDIKIAIQNFIEANRSLAKSTMVILANREIEQMESYLQYSVYTELEEGKIYSDIIIRHGDPGNAHDLSLVINENCRTIIILPKKSIVRSHGEQLDHDLRVIDILTSLSGLYHEKNFPLPDIISTYYNTITEPFPKDSRIIPLKHLTQFNPARLTGNILAQLTVAEDSYEVIKQVFSFAGCEFYLCDVGKEGKNPFPRALGHKVSDMCNHLTPAVLIGWIEGSEEHFHFCQAGSQDLDYRLQKGDKLIVLAEDDSEIHYHRLQKKISHKIVATSPAVLNGRTISQQHLLIMGWGSLVREYLRTLNKCAKEIKITIATDNSAYNEEVKTFWEQMEISLLNVVTLHEIEDCFKLIEHTKNEPITDVLLVTSEIFKSETNIRDILSIIKGKELSESLRFISEINYEKYIPMIQMLGLQNVLFPNHFIMGFLSILCEDPRLLRVYKKILDYNQANIAVITMDQYKKHRESYIMLGYYRAQKNGQRVVLCPDPTLIKAPGAGDKLVVLDTMVNISTII